MQEYDDNKPKCFAFDWEYKEIIPYDIVDFAEEIYNIKDSGFVQRTEVYAKQILQINGQKYIIRMESYGHSKRSKLILGINPLAAAYDILLFDYVYLFLEEYNPLTNKKEIKAKIQKSIKKHHFHQALKMIEFYEKIFKEKLEVQKSKCDKGIKDYQIQ